MEFGHFNQPVSHEQRRLAVINNRIRYGDGPSVFSCQQPSGLE